MMSDMQWAFCHSQGVLWIQQQTFRATSPVLRPAQSREIYWSRDINNLQRHWIFKQSDLSARSRRPWKAFILSLRLTNPATSQRNKNKRRFESCTSAHRSTNLNIWLKHALFRYCVTYLHGSDRSYNSSNASFCEEMCGAPLSFRIWVWVLSDTELVLPQRLQSYSKSTQT